MERCDFSSVLSIIRNYVSDAHEMNQVDFLYLLFDSYLSSDAGMDFDFDNGLVCRWMNGLAKISPKITAYYLKTVNQPDLERDIFHHILPLLFDSAMAEQKIYELVIHDVSISERKKQQLVRRYPCGSAQEEADFLAAVLLFAMSRDFVKRDVRTKALLSAGNLSPVLADYVMGNDVPRPCRYFCGRDRELEQLHEMLTEQGKIFLHGIAGIGKSELAKAYARQYRKEYTNILYLIYSGNLKQDIIDLDFADDLPDESTEERFRRHNRFMRSLKPDTLLIVDNFNTTATRDRFLPVLMKYRCRVLFTTRSRLENYPALLLEEISEPDALLQLMGSYYSGADVHSAELKQIIETVHGHTLAVELAARLLEHGILEPAALLRKFQEEKIALDDADKISITKDGISTKETYYGHIHTLFSLYLLSADQREIMRGMAFMPLTGIPMRRLAEWLSLRDLNTVNDLIESGFITPQPGRCVALHPMIQELILADEKPSVAGSRILCTNLQNICLLHGADIPYHKLLFAVIENIIALEEKDDLPYYLRFLEDVFPCMEKYHYETGMQTVLTEMRRLLQEKGCGSSSDRALCLDYQAACEKNTEKAIRLEKEALAQLPELNADSALLSANLQANMGALYQKAGNLSLAKQHMETGIRILEQYHLTGAHDSILQISAYAVLLADMGEADVALNALRRLSHVVKEQNSDQCSDYAEIQQVMGSICLAAGNIPQATEYFKKTMQICQGLWSNEPELLEQKYQEIAAMYPQAGIAFAKELLS